jgi:hypothetical protein
LPSTPAFAFLIGLAAYAATSALIRVRSGDSSRRRPRLARRDVWLAAALAPIVVLTLAPAGSAHNDIRLVPLLELARALAHPLDPETSIGVIGNVLLFVPLGAAFVPRGWSLGRITLTGGAVSAAIELAQLAIPGRTTSTDDVILNTLGALVGGLLGARSARRRRAAAAAASAVRPGDGPGRPSTARTP